MAQGRARQAVSRIVDQRANGPVEHLEDDAGLARVHAEALLAKGDAEAALETLASFDAAPTAGVWAQVLVARLRAQIRLGRVCDSDLQRGLSDVRDKRLPALEGLLLKLALTEALLANGDQQALMQMRAETAAHRDRLAASLDAWPSHKRGFARRFGA